MIYAAMVARGMTTDLWLCRSCGLAGARWYGTRQLIRDQQHQICMLYIDGEVPEAGDHVVDQKGRFGVVTHIIQFGSSQSEFVIKWDDGTIGIRYKTLQDFELIRRRESAEVVQ